MTVQCVCVTYQEVPVIYHLMSLLDKKKLQIGDGHLSLTPMCTLMVCNYIVGMFSWRCIAACRRLWLLTGVDTC